MNISTTHGKLAPTPNRFFGGNPKKIADENWPGEGPYPNAEQVARWIREREAREQSSILTRLEVVEKMLGIVPAEKKPEIPPQ